MCLLAPLPWKLSVGGGWPVLLSSVASKPVGLVHLGTRSGCIVLKHLLVLTRQAVLVFGVLQEGWEGWGVVMGDVRCTPNGLLGFYFFPKTFLC